MGRTKPSTTTDHNNSFGKAEVMVLRKNNQSIAKLLSQTKEELRNGERQLLALQEENMGLMVENRNLSRENRRLVGVNETLNTLLRNVYQASKAQMPVLQKLVETFSYIFYETGKSMPVGGPMSQEVDPQFGLMPASPHSSAAASPTKRQAVKPMVSGHIIHRPTVNLPRLATEELARLAADVANSSSGEPDDEANGEYNITGRSENEYEANNDGDENGDDHSESPPPNSPVNERLDTLQEADENVSAMNSIEQQFGTSGGNAPLLSGVFRDLNLKVYLPPLPNIQAHMSRQPCTNRPSEVAEHSPPSVASTSSRETPERSVGRPSVARRSSRTNAAGRPSKRRGGGLSSDLPLSSPPHITKRKRTSPMGRQTVDLSTTDRSTLVNAGSVDEEDEEDKTMVNENGGAGTSDVATATESEGEDHSKKIETLSGLGLEPLKYTSTPCTSHSSFRKSLESYTPTTPIPANVRRRNKSLSRRPTCKVMMKQLALPARRSKSPPRENQEDIDAGSSNITPEKRNTRNEGRKTHVSKSAANDSSDEQMSPAWTPDKPKKKQSSKPKKQQKMPTCKVMVKQLSLLKKRSLSPLKKKSLSPMKKKSMSPLKKKSISPSKSDGGTRRRSSSIGSPVLRVSPRKSSPIKWSSSGRPMRSKRPISLKEMPLKHKMRRDK